MSKWMIAMNKYSRDEIARCLFNVAMVGHAQWDNMTERNKEDWRVKADAWIQNVTNMEEVLSQRAEQSMAAKK